MESVGLGRWYDTICHSLFREEKYQELSDLISNLSRLCYKYARTIGREIGDARILLGKTCERKKKACGEAEEWSEWDNIAMEQWTEAINIFKEIGDEERLTIALRGLGDNQLDRAVVARPLGKEKLERGEWSEAEKIFQKQRGEWREAINTFKEIGDEGRLVIALSGLGDNQTYRAVVLGRIGTEKLARAAVLHRLGEAKRERDELRDVEEIIQELRSEWSDAKKNFQEVIEIIQTNFPNSQLKLAYSVRSLGKALWALGNDDKAVEAYVKARDIYGKLEMFEEQKKVEEILNGMKLL